MAYYTTTLRDIIYHYSQDKNPEALAKQNAGEGRYPFFKPEYDVPVWERIATAEKSMIDKNIQFFSEQMKDDFFQLFCTDNLTREIEYESVTMFLLRFNGNIRRVIWRYNKLYEIMQKDFDLLNSFSDETSRSVNEGENTENSGNMHTSATNTNKNVYEDTPESALGNEDYATNITTDNGSGSSDSNSSDKGERKRDLTETVTHKGFTIPQGEVLKRNRDTLPDVIGEMVREVSRGLFLKIFTF